jgi:hypothetical protein
VKAERVKHREVLRTWIQQAQGLLIWLVDRQRGSFGAEPTLFATRNISPSSPWAASLHDKCLASTQAWVEHLSFLLNGYIGYTKALMDLEAKLNETPGPALQKATLSPEETTVKGANEDDEAELVPLKVAKSLSLPIARQPHQGVRLSPTESSIQLITSHRYGPSSSSRFRL